jgi:hypothetical protein
MAGDMSWIIIDQKKKNPVLYRVVRRQSIQKSSDHSHQVIDQTCSDQGPACMNFQQGPCLVSQIHPKFHYKKRFPVTSKYWHIYGVLNINEIKN